jgi:hypothetical protein
MAEISTSMLLLNNGVPDSIFSNPVGAGAEAVFMKNTSGF